MKIDINELLNYIFTNYKNCDPCGFEKKYTHKDCQNKECPFYIEDNDCGYYKTCQLNDFVTRTNKIESHQK